MRLPVPSSVSRLSCISVSRSYSPVFQFIKRGTRYCIESRMLVSYRTIGCLHVEKSAYFNENDATSFRVIEKLNCFISCGHFQRWNDEFIRFDRYVTIENLWNNWRIRCITHLILFILETYLFFCNFNILLSLLSVFTRVLLIVINKYIFYIVSLYSIIKCNLCEN